MVWKTYFEGSDYVGWPVRHGVSDSVRQTTEYRKASHAHTHTLECIFSVLPICHSLLISNKPGTKRWYTCSNCYILTQIMYTDSAGCWIWPINQCFKQEIKVVHRSKPVQCFSLDGASRKDNWTWMKLLEIRAGTL